jgi:hypothetical protein
MKIFARVIPILLIVLTAMLAACQCFECYDNNYTDITDYEVNEDAIHLVNGLQLDDPNCEVDFVDLMHQIEYLDECIEEDIRWACITVKVAPDWEVSPHTGAQLFPCERPESVCERKEGYLDEYECDCRAIIQDETTVITAPNLALFKAEIVRMVTGINDPWQSPYAHCVDS